MEVTPVNLKHIGGFKYISEMFTLSKTDTILIDDFKPEKYIEHINKNNVKKAYLKYLFDFGFIKACPNLERITIDFDLPFEEYERLASERKKLYRECDLSPIESLKNLEYLHIMNSDVINVKAKARIDTSKFNNLAVYRGNYDYTENLCKTVSLKSVWLNKYRKKDLEEFNQLTDLDTVYIGLSGIKSLKGIENWKNLQCMYIFYNSSLTDISLLKSAKSTLKALRIGNCNKIEDFSVLGELENLELLQLSGRNTIPSLDFIKRLKNLKTLTLRMNVLDGDLTPCLNLSTVYSEIDRKHYNLKDIDLPKSEFVVRGSESIEGWRRFE